jgi:hypothetical protein
MRRRLSLLGLGTLCCLSLAHAEDSMPASTQRINELVSSIAGQLATTEALQQSAVAQGQGIRASCVAGAAEQLQKSLDAARALQADWNKSDHNAAYGQRIMNRVNDLELSANAETADARQCNDVSKLGFTLEVIVPPSLPDEPKGWSIATPPIFERPPLASPY